MEDRTDLHPKMPAEVAALYEPIWQEVARLHSHWKIFSQLYAESAERVAFLDSMAPSFFGVVQEAMLHNLLLSITRLTDDTRTGKRDNLSFSRLIESIDASQEPEFAENLSNALKKIKTQREPFRDWRNRKIAHKDLSTALHYHPQPLPRINKEMIEKVLGLMRELLNTFQGYYEDAETAFEHVVLRGDGKALVFYLEQAKEYEMLKREEQTRRLGIEPNSSD